MADTGLHDATTGRKKSLTAASEAEAIALVEALQQKIKEASPITTHTAIDGSVTHKSSQFRNPRDVDARAKKLEAQLCVRRPYHCGRSPGVGSVLLFGGNDPNRQFGLVKPATHHSRLRLATNGGVIAKGRAGLPTTRGPRINDHRANSGKATAHADSARRLKEYLFAQADLGDEGALAC